MGDKIKILAYDEEIKEALDAYTHSNDSELLSYKFYGGVRRIGYYSDEDVPIFEGVALKLKRKGKTRKRYK